jgi:serine/threonine protein kinase
MPRAEVVEQGEARPFRHRWEAHSEPIPGYRLIEPLGSGGFGEVWKAEAPGGLLKAIKFVHGSPHALDEAHAPAEEELRAIARVKAIRHPFLLSMERVEVVDGELVIVLELADKNLGDLLAEARAAGKPGVPREALLGYLREAAEALDLMNVRYDLQHLDVKPQNLFLVSNHVKVGDFGLVNSLKGAHAAAVQLGAITPLYASPEVFQGSLSRHSDQYSLAVVYQELLTGTLLFDGRNSRQLLMQHIQGEPDLRPLPPGDRLIVARALSKNPQSRFPSCSDFLHALTAGQTEVVIDHGPEGAVRPSALAAGKADEDSCVLGAPLPDPAEEQAAAERLRDTDFDNAPTQFGAEEGPRETLADYRFQECLACSPLTEVWSARLADGRRRLAKVIFGWKADGPTVARLRSLRHPALLPAEVIHNSPGRLVLGAVPAESSLRECYQEYVARGLPGVPREELLGHLREAAAALDFLAHKHGLYHLGLNPRNLLLDGGRLRVADFGLAQLLWLPAGQAVAGLNARYSAPELFRRDFGPSTDQYSLALIYAEMLTGTHPLRGQTGAQAPRVSEADLGRLPEPDRAAVARALEPSPQRRWASATDFVRALEGAGAGRPAALAPAVIAPAAARREEAPAETGDELQSRFGTKLEVAAIRSRLDGFREHWKGTLLRADERDFAFLMKTPQTLWQRWTGRQPALEVHVRLGGRAAGAQGLTEVRVSVRPRGAAAGQSAELLKVVGPLLVESVRGYLQVNPAGRREERLTWNYPLQVCSVGPDGAVGRPVECQGKDISLTGIGFYLPGELPTTLLLLHLPQTPQTPAMSVRAKVVRVQGCSEGWYEVGAVLVRDAEPTGEA